MRQASNTKRRFTHYFQHAAFDDSKQNILADGLGLAEHACQTTLVRFPPASAKLLRCLCQDCEEARDEDEHAGSHVAMV